jgi:hypothetical protein
MTQWQPDYTATKLAQAILDREINGTPFAVDVLEAARQQIDSVTRYAAEQDRQRARVIAAQDAYNAVLDSDVPTPGMPCGHRVYASSRDIRGHACGRISSVLRTWTTSEMAGWELDGQPLLDAAGNPFAHWSDIRIPGGWELGKGFTDRPLSDEEIDRLVPVRKTVTHTATLCGTHRRMRGQYGLPY